MVLSIRYGRQITTKLEYFLKYFLITLSYFDITAVFLEYQNLKDQQRGQLFSKMSHIATQYRHQLDSTTVQLKRRIFHLHLKDGLLWYSSYNIGKNDWAEYKRLYGYEQILSR